MDGPFFKNSFRGIPVDPVQRKSNVVSIPVHFVGSETTRLASALKIQKVFRGFAVRRSVKKISSIRYEVEDIEWRILERETVGLIRRENKERLRLNERLMTLLFKLDSVRGVDSGVRNFRKAVIKKAIELQERIDAIASGNQALEVENSSEHQNLGTEGKESNIKPSGSKLIEDVNNHCSKKSAHESDEVHCPEGGQAVAETDDDEKMRITEGKVDSEVVDDEEDCIVKQIVEEQLPTSEFVEEVAETEPNFSDENGDENLSERGSDGIKLKVECHKKNTEVLERLVEDNEKLMSLMTQLCERNETQTRMLILLTRRVDQLERAFICDRLRKKKKKRHAIGTTDCLGSTPTPDENKGAKR